MKSCLYVFVTAVWLLAFGASAAIAQTTATVNVDCSKGKSINKALDQHKNAQSLIVEIEGMRHENVVVTRDSVTLRGANPATDGIQAVANATQIDAALWVRGAHQVVDENLKLTGGFAGLLATEVSTPSLISSSNAVLLGVTHFRSETPNVVDANSFVRIADASPATGGPATIPSAVMGFSLTNFSSGSLVQTSQTNGNVTCGSGANAFCANPANMSGTSNCALCPKPRSLHTKERETGHE